MEKFKKYFMVLDCKFYFTEALSFSKIIFGRGVSAFPRGISHGKHKSFTPGGTRVASFFDRGVYRLFKKCSGGTKKVPCVIYFVCNRGSYGGLPGFLLESLEDCPV